MHYQTPKSGYMQLIVVLTRSVLACLLFPAMVLPAVGQAPDMPMPIEFENSAEFRWMDKEVHDARALAAIAQPGSWSLEGTARLSFPEEEGPAGTSIVRVDMDMFTEEPAPTSRGLSAATLTLDVPDEDWSNYNRLAVWIRPDISGFPMLPLNISLHNDGDVTLPDLYRREGIHYATLEDGVWQRVFWEISPLARDRVTAIDIGYWVNKLLADQTDRVAFEIGGVELQRVDPDHYEGWDVAPGRISYSHTGYQTGASKTALASRLTAPEFEVVRIDDVPLGEVVLRKPIETVTSRLGEYQLLDFSMVRKPGRYVVRAGDVRTRPFRIDDDVWRGTIWKAINFFYGERCGYPVPGSHGVNHRDWMATHGDQAIVMNGGWHDAGDLSQGMINTGEATYAMFDLAERLQERGDDQKLLERLLEEAKWGLDWVLRVRFDGGYRIGFAGNNLWTNGILGDADDRSREALNNPNVNYIAAAAGAIAYRVLKGRDPELAARSLRVAEADWEAAIHGTPGPETWSTPAYMAVPIELAGIGILASMELFEATGERRYAEKAFELANVIVESQQKTFVGSEFPLAGFFYEGPDRERLFHQFHLGNDQAPIVALARLVEAFPDHGDWMAWYAVVARYGEYQKTVARTTDPYEVLPAYVYHDADHLRMPETLDRYRATPEAYQEQVLQGMAMGDGYYLRAFPVWFNRRGNFGVLLSQAKALSTAAHLRRDGAAADLAQKQAQWIVGRNPFSQSTMYGEGYNWTQQYSVSSGDIVGSLPVGMQTRGARDVPYWPAQNMYVYKEVWVHPVSRWIWLMEDLAGSGSVEGRTKPGVAGRVEFVEEATGRVLQTDVGADGRFRAVLPQGRYDVRHGGRSTTVSVLPAGTHEVDLRPGEAVDFDMRAETTEEGDVTIILTATGEGVHTFTLRTENLEVNEGPQELTFEPGVTSTARWTAAVKATDEPWVAVVVPDGDVRQRRDVVGALPSFSSSALRHNRP